MATNTWQVFLANSSNLSLNAEVTPEARGKSLNISMNRAGSFSFNLPLSSDAYSYLNPGQHCVLLNKNGTTVWSGPIWAVEEDFTSAKINVESVGWFQLLHKRYALDEMVFTSQLDGNIALYLLGYANTREVPIGTPRHTGINGGTNTTTTVRESFTVEQWENIGEKIEELTEIEAGLDFEIDPATRNFNCYDSAEFDDNGVIFGFNWGPDNATGVTRRRSIDEAGNQYYVIGEDVAAEASDTTNMGTNGIGLHQQVININETSDLGILAAIANAELAVNKDGRVLINFAPRPPAPDKEMPSLFTDFNLRDKVYITAIRDGVTIQNQAVRVFAVNLELEDNGLERIASLSTTYQSG